MKIKGLILLFCILLVAMTACGSPTPTPNSVDARVAQGVGATLTAIASNSSQKTSGGVTPASTSAATLAPTLALSSGQASTGLTPVPATAGSTAVAPTPATAVRPTVAALRTLPPAPSSGIHVTNIRLDPPAPKEKQDVWFYATLMNSSGVEKTVRWFIYVYRADKTDPFGQTSWDKRGDGQDILPVGTRERKALNSWRLFGGDGYCQDYWAKAFWYDLESGARNELTDPNGREYLKRFTVCPSPS